MFGLITMVLRLYIVLPIVKDVMLSVSMNGKIKIQHVGNE